MIDEFKESYRREAANLQKFVSSGDLENSLRCIMNLTSLATVVAIYAEDGDEDSKEVAEKTKAFLSGKAISLVVKKFGK